MNLVTILFELVLFEIINAKLCNVLDFGAVGDGVTDDTSAIQKALDNCTSNDEESIILLPSSYIFYSYPIRLNKNNLHLWIETNSTLYISPNFTSGKWPYNNSTKHYTNIIQNGESKNLSNISIYGNGLINGNGQIWYPLINTHEVSGRPHTIWIEYCQNVSIYNITILNSPAYNLNLHQNKDVIVHDINFTAPSFLIAPNTDGIDISSQNVHIYNSYIANGDDTYCLNSGASNVLIENSTAKYGLGLAADAPVGYSPPIQNVTFRNMLCDQTYFCIRLKPGPVNHGINCNGTMLNFTFENIEFNMVTAGIDVNQFNETTPYNVTTPPPDKYYLYSSEYKLQYNIMNNMTFNNIYGTYTSYAGHIDCAVEQPCINLQFQNVDLIGKGLNGSNYAWSCSENVYGTAVNVTPPLNCLNQS
eukprot:514093_1